MGDLEIKGTETQAIVDLAAQIHPVEMLSNKHIRRVALPPDWILDESNDEKLLPAPARKTGALSLDDTDSFINYINRHKISDLTTVYCKANYKSSEIKFICVLNDHGGALENQQWRDHTASYSPVFAEEWLTWTRNDKQSKTQLDMALFIEENLNDLASVDGYPTGTQLLEMATSFHANQDMRFKSAVRLQNGGVNMSFVQDDDNQTLNQMKMFERIAIGIPVFRSGDPYQITARLRYRVKDGRVVFWYELIRSDKVIEHATKEMIEKIKTDTNVFFYFGSAI